MLCDKRADRLSKIVRALAAQAAVPQHTDRRAVAGCCGDLNAVEAGVACFVDDHAGAARVFGLVGLVLAVLNPTVNFLAVSLSWLSSIG